DENPINIQYATPPRARPQNESTYSRTIALILCLTLGGMGGHQFYVGKSSMGFIYLVTSGFCGIGVFIDLILILFGSFTDDSGRIVSNWSGGSGRYYQPVTYTQTVHTQPVHQIRHPAYIPAQTPTEPHKEKQTGYGFEKEPVSNYCPNCGYDNDSASTTCSSCGSMLKID
ncbi:MAG: NINE protein, partial [Candidatus Heimdallarchaeota archaeon]